MSAMFISYTLFRTNQELICLLVDLASVLMASEEVQGGNFVRFPLYLKLNLIKFPKLHRSGIMVASMTTGFFISREKPRRRNISE